MDPLEAAIEEIKKEFGEDSITTTNTIDRPQESLDRDMFVDFNERNPMMDGGMLVKPNADGSRPGYKKDNPGSIYKDGNGYSVRIGAYNNPNQVQGYFGAKKYGSLEKAKKAAETFRVKEAKNFQFAPQGPQTGKQAAAEKAIQELLDEGKEITSPAVKEKLPKNLQKDFTGNKSYFSKAKKSFPNLDFKKSPRKFLKAPKEIAAVKKLIEDGLPLKEIQAKGYDVGFIKRVAKSNELKIAETSREYFENIKKVSNDLTKIGKNKKIVQAFENGTVSKDLINQVGKVTKSGDPFYDSRLLFKLAEYYDGSLEKWYKPKLPKPTANQLTNSDKVIKSSATFLGGKRNGYAYQNFLYDWGAKKIDQVLNLPLGTFRGIQRDIARTLPSGISLDEVFGVKSSGRFAPVEGILTNPLESGANVDKGSFVDNVKSNYQKQLVDASGNPKKQKEILKDYNDVVQKSKVRYPDVEFPNYKVGTPPNKTIKGFDKLPPLIQNRLLENYKTTGISPVTKKAVSIFDVAKATGSKTFGKLDESVQASLSNITSKQEKSILNNLQINSKLPECKISAADGGRIGFALSDECIRDGLNETKKKAAAGDKKAARQLVETAEAASKGGRLLKNVLGPGAILGEAVFEGAIIGNKVLGGKELDQAWAESYLSYLDPRKYSGQLDPLKMERKDMLESTADKNILRSGFAAQDQLSAFNKALQDRDLAKARGRIDQYNPAAANAREQGRFADQSADIISSEAFKDASNVAQEYLQGKAGEQMGKFGVLSVPQGDDADNLRRLKANKAMQNLYTQYSDKELMDMLSASKPLQDAGISPQDYLNMMAGTERITPAVTSTMSGLDRLRSNLQEYEAMQNLMGGAANFAGGGIAGLSGGVDEGPQRRSMNPDSQGLQGLLNRVKKL